MVVWLQNNEGYSRWGPTESRVEALLEAFRPVRDKERDKAQQDAANATILNPSAEPAGRTTTTDWPTNVFKPPPPSTVTATTVTTTATATTTTNTEPKSASVQQWLQRITILGIKNFYVWRMWIVHFSQAKVHRSIYKIHKKN